jgi:tetratricopeptide (TPR) repeat protein
MQRLDEAQRTGAAGVHTEPNPPVQKAADETVAKPESSSGSIARAVEQIERGQHGVAIFTARRAVSDDPDNAYAWSVLAQAASVSNDHPTALDAIERALHLDPEDARLHAQRGEVLQAAGEHDKALSAYQAAASLQADEPEYQVAVIDQMIVAGNVDAAIRAAQEAYRAQPDEGLLRNALGRALAERAELAQHELPDGQLLITTKEQAQLVESLVGRGLSVQPSDPDVYADLVRHRDYARKASRLRFSAAALKQNYKWPVGLGFIALGPMCCLWGGLKPGTDLPTKALTVLGALGGLALFLGAVLRGCFQPQYAYNAVLIEKSEPRRMGRVDTVQPPGARVSRGRAR